MKHAQSGFTLIELMIVMLVASLLMGLVGPTTINSIDKAQAKQELLSIRNWLLNISMRAYTTGYSYAIRLDGKGATLYRSVNNEQQQVVKKSFKYNFFPPQSIRYYSTGFVDSPVVTTTFKNKTIQIDLAELVNKQYSGS